MPILKANEQIPERPVIIALYGEPGSCKTTLGNTADKVLVLDFDRGVSRSFNRQDTLIMNSWEDVITEEKAGTFKNYKTLVIDTAKAALDDMLMPYVVSRDFKLKTNKLKAYGELGDEFKLFLNSRRNEGLDVIIIAHAKKDEDTKKSIPDVTGQSYQLILRVADQVGYVNFVNNERTIQWTPTDLTVGKNTANLPMISVPDKSNPDLKHFMADVIEAVKKSIVSMSEAQREALLKSEAYQAKVMECDSPDKLTDLLIEVNELELHLRAPLKKLIIDKSKEKGWVANTETKRFELPVTDHKPVDPPVAEKTPKEIMPTDINTRCAVLQQAGMILEGDRASIGDLAIEYIPLEQMTEEQFNDLVAQVATAKKGQKKVAAAKKLKHAH